MPLLLWLAAGSPPASSSAPLALGGGWLRLLRLLKLTKALRVSSNTLVWSSARLLQYSRFTTGIHLGGLLLTLGLAIHYMACAWHLAAHERHWELVLYAASGAAAVDSAGGDDAAGGGGLGCLGARGGCVYGEQHSTRYVLAFYESVLLLMGEQLSLGSDSERVFASIAIVLGAVVLAIIFGEVAMLIAKVNNKAFTYRQKMTKLYDAMAVAGLHKTLQDRIYAYYSNLWKAHSSLDGQLVIETFLPELSPNLAKEIRLHTYKDMILKVGGWECRCRCRCRCPGTDVRGGHDPQGAHVLQPLDGGGAAADAHAEHHLLHAARLHRGGRRVRRRDVLRQVGHVRRLPRCRGAGRDLARGAR